MSRHMPISPISRRRGFTLIEMLVVMTLIIVLATIAVLVAPRFSETQRISLAGGQVQGWLFTAKQRAYRDKLVRGLRPLTFISTSPNPIAGPGTQTVTPVSMGTNPGPPEGIHVGSLLLIDRLGSPEFVTVIATPSPTSFTATFSQAHAAGFWIDDAYPKAFQYIEQPDDFSLGTINQGTANVVQFNMPTTGAGPTLQNFDLRTEVQPGDLLVIRGTEVHQIAAVPPAPPTPYPPPPALPTVTLLTPLASDIAANSQVPYRIIRTPRALTGEPVLQLPQDTAVDLPRCSPSLPVDVLFSPSGGVQGAGSQGKIIWWVRDTVKSPYEGGPTLIAIYGRTGAIAAHPVNADSQGNVYPGGPYFFTQDGRNSGM
jgi:prepilin-type N-terminal cleavage/methylation domain-containing protein